MGNDNKATFLQATQQEEDFLRRLAYGSEASWGYDKKFMDKFDQEFNIDAAFIKRTRFIWLSPIKKSSHSGG